MVRGLQKTLTLPTLKSGLTLNTNEKCPASLTKTGGNCTPLGAINNNGRAKCSITKSLKQQAIDTDTEWEGSQGGAATGRKEASELAESISALKTHSEEVEEELKVDREPESLIITDTIATTSL